MSDEDDERRRRQAEAIFQQAMQSGSLTPEDRTYIREIAVSVAAGQPVSWIDRLRVRQILGRVIFGS